ncbi:MAG: hypothetical protein H6R18_1603 [Proteobacteria bacterium]|nr:hypothetical protein [Pseudomonadota bacterium]
MVLWTLDDFVIHDPDRGQCLRGAPPWADLIRAVRRALGDALKENNVRFGMDESGRDTNDLRGVVQFPLGRKLFDWFFNAQTGYRAQFRIGRENGLVKNADLIRELRAELELSRATAIVIHRLTSDFEYKVSRYGTIGEVATTLDEALSKVWICEKLIVQSGSIQDLFVSRTGPKLLFSNSDAWSSLYPENGDGWLDVKGAFIGPIGPYQLRPPEARAAKLEERGTA